MFKNIKTAEQLAAEQLVSAQAQKVTEAKAYLANTDWIISKVGEAAMLGEGAEVLKTKYAVEIAAREEARALINLHE
ncbi:hypothetical protein [Marinomonas shanghaiensis]|uniref:hypothetical protein n=1 Tax=Marinomonas shanghaiensis TaxID=2202418 RepID=UPI000DBACA82|nr:hypothetical protein [Marinomonas shanghaiensis]